MSPKRGTRTGPAAMVAVALALLTACTGATTSAPPDRTTRTVVSTSTDYPGADYRPRPARYVPHLPPGGKAPAGEVDRRCPYITTGLDQDGYDAPTPNVAKIEGDRIYRTTVLTRLDPVGCRFYYYAPPYEAVADIVPRRFGSHAEAYNAMVRTAEAGRQVESVPDFARGVVGISYRTRFFDTDGDRDWAFVFATGRTLVVVHTQRTDTSQPAVYLAQAVVDRF